MRDLVSNLLDGLESAAAGAQFKRDQIEKILSSLGNRVFLMNNTHEDAPELMQTRWVLSYMRGPLMRDQIKVLMDPWRGTATTPARQAAPAVSAPVSALTPAIQPTVPSGQPALPPGISAFFLPTRGGQAASQGGDLLGSLLGGDQPAPQAGGQQPDGIDLGDLLNAGMTFMNAKQQGLWDKNHIVSNQGSWWPMPCSRRLVVWPTESSQAQIVAGKKRRAYIEVQWC